MKNSDKSSTVFLLAFTPLHVLIYVALNKTVLLNKQTVLILCNAKKTQNIVQLLQKSSQDALFDEILEIVNIKKYALFQQEAKALVMKYHPCEIYTGNDKKFYFQFFMHFSKKYIKNQHVKGCYVDDGFSSYTTSKIKVNTVKRFKRKLLRPWFEYVETMGTSSWVKQSFLMAPDKSQNKHTNTCDIAEVIRNSNELEKLSLFVAKDYSLNSNVNKRNWVLLPSPYEKKHHSKSIAKLKQICKNSKHELCIVKPHPDDEVSYKANNILELPAAIPVELMSFMMKESDTVYAGRTSAAMTLNLLRPNVKLLSIDR